MPQRDVAAGVRGRQLALLAAVALPAAGYVAAVLDWHHFFDLAVYYGAVNFWSDGGMLYDYLRPVTRYGFTYPPFAALLMLPMAYVPWPVAVVVNVSATVVSTVVVLGWLIGPIARRRGWPCWLAVAIATCLVAALDPVHESFGFGQINMLLVLLVAADLLRLGPRRSRWAGVGIGLATAIKLTPGIFLLYLLVTGRWRAAATACGTAAAATLGAAAVAPDAAREFWTAALWNSDRVGDLAYISNQSLRGALARFAEHPSTLLWLASVVAVLTVWAWRCRAAGAADDAMGGLALAGVVGCLVSPVTWVHHLVWLIPALVRLVDVGLAATERPLRRRWLGFAAGAYLLLASRVVWIWRDNEHGWGGAVFGSAYVWLGIALLVALPVGDRARRGPAEAAAPRPAGARPPRPGHPGHSALSVRGRPPAPAS